MEIHEFEIRTGDKLNANRQQAVERLTEGLQTGEEQILREHQISATESIRDFLARGETAGYIDMPPRSGKTKVFANLIKILGLNAVIASPSTIILKQNQNTAEASGVDVTNYYSKQKDIPGDNLNTTYQSLPKLIAQGVIKPEDVGLVILDESDTALGEQRHKVLREFPNAIMLGFTATPFFTPVEGYLQRGLVKGDERWLGVFRNLIHEMSLEEAIERGILTNLEVHILKTNSTVRDIQMSASGDYRRSEIDRQLNTNARNLLAIGLIAGPAAVPDKVRMTGRQFEEIENIHQIIQGKRTVVFGLSINHIETLANELRKVGIKAEAIHSGLPEETRNQILARHKSGETQVILGVDVLKRGWDSPETEVALHMAPTKSSTVAVQEICRILTLSPQTDKKSAVAIQLVDDFDKGYKSPILIPDIFDPYFVKRGTQVGHVPRIGNSHSTTEGSLRPPVTFEGMDLNLIVERANIREIIQTKLKTSSLTEIAAGFDDLVLQAVTEEPEISTLALFGKIAMATPHFVPTDRQMEMMQAIASIDSNTAKIGRQVMLFMNAKTILSALEPFLEDGDEQNAELTSEVIATLTNKFNSLSRNTSVAQQIHTIVRDAARTYLSLQANMPKEWIEQGLYQVVQEGVGLALKERPYGLDKAAVNQLATELSAKTGLSERTLKTYIISRNESETKQSGINSESLFDMTTNEYLKERIESVLLTLTERQRKIIRMRFGLDDGRERTLEEVGREFGVHRDRIRQVEAKALRALRHPSRSKQLVDFLNEDLRKLYRY